MEDNFDVKVNKALNSVPAPAEKTLDTIWSDLENRIDFDKKKVNDNKRTFNKRFILKLSSGIAAALIVVITLTSTPVKAMINDIVSYFGFNSSQDYFTEEKGSIKVNASIYESKLGYITYYDSEYFDVTKTDVMERFVPKVDNGKGSGQSFFEVKLIDNATAQEAADNVVKEFKQHYSDVKVIDKNSIAYFSYLYNPLEGLKIEGYDSNVTNKKKSMKKDTFYEFCSIGELKGIGTVSISYKFNRSDEDTSNRINKIYSDLKIINKNDEKLLQQGPNILVFDYDKTKYRLVKLKGEQYTYLSPITSKSFDPGILSIGHFYNKDMEKAAQEIISNTTIEKKPTDINLKSIMLAAEDYKNYLIDDGQGGFFQLFFIVTSNKDLEEITKTLEILPQKGNEELMKPEEIEPTGVG